MPLQIFLTESRSVIFMYDEVPSPNHQASLAKKELQNFVVVTTKETASLSKFREMYWNWKVQHTRWVFDQRCAIKMDLLMQLHVVEFFFCDLIAIMQRVTDVGIWS